MNKNFFYHGKGPPPNGIFLGKGNIMEQTTNSKVSCRGRSRMLYSFRNPPILSFTISNRDDLSATCGRSLSLYHAPHFILF